MAGRRSHELLRKCQGFIEGVPRRRQVDLGGAHQAGNGGKNLGWLMCGGGDLLVGDLVEDPTRSWLVEHRVDERAGVKHDQWPNSTRTSASRSAVSIAV